MLPQRSVSIVAVHSYTCVYVLIPCSSDNEHEEHDGDANGGSYRPYNRSFSAPQCERVRISNIIIVACIYMNVFIQLNPYPLAACYQLVRSVFEDRFCAGKKK